MSRQPGHDQAEETARVRAAIRDLGIVGAAAALVCAGLVVWYWSSAPKHVEGTSRVPRAPGRNESMFVGSTVCRDCHPGESAAHSRSGHSHTLRRAEVHSLSRTLDGKTVRDKEYDALWEFAFKDGELTTTRTEAGKQTRFVIDYAFGSGEHGTTFVSLTDRTPRRPAAVEHRMSFFTSRGEFDVTPGQSKQAPANPAELTPEGRFLGAERTLECFGCHSTLLSTKALEELDTTTMISNISCERCHGPARLHVEAARRQASNLKMPFGPDGSTADQQMRACGFCHRHPDSLPKSSIHAGNRALVRFQPVALMQSKCYTRTSGGVACTVCHDPHSRASADRDRYELACLECHKAPPQAVCSVSPANGCIGCHMPLRDAVPGVKFHDHWIRVFDSAERSAPAAPDPAAPRPAPRAE